MRLSTAPAMASQLLLLLLLLGSATALAMAAAVDDSEGRPSSSDVAVLSRQKRTPALLIPVGVAVARVAGRYVVTIGTKMVRHFASRKDVVNFLRQPSTLRAIDKLPKTHGNVVNVPSKTMAKDVAKRLSNGKKPVNHPNPNRGNPHFHPVDKKGNLKPQHISHPKPGPKTRTKYSPGKNSNAVKAQNRNGAKVGGSKSGGSMSGGSKTGGSKTGGSRGRGSMSGGSRSGGSRSGGSRSGGSRSGGSRSGGSRSGGSRSGGSRSGGSSGGGSRGGGSRGGGSRGGGSRGGGSRGGKRG